MRRSTIHMYAHLVWATKGREPLITSDNERAIYRCIEKEAGKFCELLAIGGMSDHVHLAVKTPALFSVAALMKQVKGVSSALANNLVDHQVLFRWQEGYGAYSFAEAQTPRVIAYIENQARHHAEGTLWGAWEETHEEAPP